MEFTVNMGWLQAEALAGVRMSAFIVIAPPFSYRAIPMRVKAMIAIALALLVGPVVTDGYRAVDGGAFLTGLAMQALVGAALGFLVYLLFAAIQSAGDLVDVFGGFRIAAGFDPGMEINGAQFTRLFQMTALTLLFSSGAYQLVLGALAKTFQVLPLDAGFRLDVPIQLMIDGSVQLFVAALQFAGPLIIVLFLADAGLGLLTRVAPALHAFTMSYPIKILVVLVFGGFTYLALPGFVAGLTDDAVTALGWR